MAQRTFHWLTVGWRGHTVTVVVVSFILLESLCQGVYQEYNVADQCDKSIDLASDSAVAGKLTLSANNKVEDNCTVTLIPWFAWKRIAFELKDYHLEDGACVSLEQDPVYRFVKETIGTSCTLMEICQRGSNTEVTGNHTSTDGYKKLVIKYTPGTRPKSGFVLRFFGFSGDLPCDSGVLCDEDKCLTSVMMCKSYYLYGHCADATRCHRPKPKEESFKLSTGQILGIVAACLAIPNMIYVLYRCCCKKTRETSDVPLESPYPVDQTAADQTGKTASSEPGKPSPSAPPPTYGDAMTGYSKDSNTGKMVA